MGNIIPLFSIRKVSGMRTVSLQNSAFSVSLGLIPTEVPSSLPQGRSAGFLEEALVLMACGMWNTYRVLPKPRTSLCLTLQFKFNASHSVPRCFCLPAHPFPRCFLSVTGFSISSLPKVDCHLHHSGSQNPGQACAFPEKTDSRNICRASLALSRGDT